MWDYRGHEDGQLLQQIVYHRLACTTTRIFLGGDIETVFGHVKIESAQITICESNQRLICLIKLVLVVRGFNIGDGSTQLSENVLVNTAKLVHGNRIRVRVKVTKRAHKIPQSIP